MACGGTAARLAVASPVAAALPGVAQVAAVVVPGVRGALHHRIPEGWFWPAAPR
jgi:hypothetical protein